jgi:hypothetical protein
MTPFETDVCILAAVWLFISAATIAEAVSAWWARRKARRRLRWMRRCSLRGGLR